MTVILFFNKEMGPF